MKKFLNKKSKEIKRVLKYSRLRGQKALVNSREFTVNYNDVIKIAVVCIISISKGYLIRIP